MNILLISSLISFALIAGLYWFMPYVTPPSIQFGVRVPRQREEDHSILSVRKQYHAILLAGTAAVFLLFNVLPAVFAIYWITTFGIFVEIIAAYLTYLRSFRKLKRLKDSQGWYSDTSESSGAVYTGEKERSGVSVALTMLPAIIIVVLTFYIGITIYPSIPHTFATHFGANGQPNGYSTKSVATVFLVPFIQAGMTAGMFILGFVISGTRQEVDISRPLASSEQQEKFKTYVVRALFLFTAVIDFTLLSSSLMVWGYFPPGIGTIVTLVTTLAGSAILVVVLMSYGQMGSRIEVPAADKENTGKINRNDDRYWIGGALYYNRDDPALLVAKRFGVGWTLNFGHFVAWLVLIVPLTIPVFIILFRLHIV